MLRTLISFFPREFAEERKRNPDFSGPFRPAKAPYNPIPGQVRNLNPRPPVPVQARALPVTQSGKTIQCFGCREWGHKKIDCPNAKDSIRPPLPLQKHAFQNRNQGRPNPRNPTVNTARVNHVTISDETVEQAHIYAALDPRGYNRQYSILEVQGEHEGKIISFLVDSGSSHSFLSPSTIKRLQLPAQPTGRKLRVSLANGSNILTDEQTIEIPFQLSENPTCHKFRILKLGKFQGILGMDWLSQNDSDINCKRGLVSFVTSEGKRVQVPGTKRQSTSPGS